MPSKNSGTIWIETIIWDMYLDKICDKFGLDRNILDYHLMEWACGRINST